MFQFLPREAMRKRGLCCGPVSVRPSVCLTVCHVGGLYPESRRLKISSDFFLGPVAPSFWFFYPPPGADTQFPSAGAQNTGVCDFRLKLPSILETVRDRPLVAMER